MTETGIEVAVCDLVEIRGVRDYVSDTYAHAVSIFGTNAVADYLADKGYVRFMTAGFVHIVTGDKPTAAVEAMRQYGIAGATLTTAKGALTRVYLRGLANQLLAELPGTPRSIAEFFDVYGAKGMPHVSNGDPVSVWLTECTGFACYVGDSHVTWYGDFGHVSIIMSDPLAAFVYEFDREGYPDLITWVAEQQHRLADRG